jgi:lysophospholipase L1-like esterase
LHTAAKKGGCLLAATLASLAVTELGLRLAGVGSRERGAPWYAGGNHPRHLFAPDPAAGYRLRSGFAGREVARSGEFDLSVAVDDLGLRAGSRVPDPAHRQGGVVALGDSLTFGEGVEFEQTWTHLLERELGAPVVNAGVPGYSSRQMAALLDEHLRRFSPRLVLVTFSPRWDLARCAEPFVYREGFIVSADHAPRLYLAGDNLEEVRFRNPRLAALSAQLAARSRLAHLLLVAAPAVVVLADSLSPAFQVDARAAAQLLSGRQVEVLRLDHLLPEDRRSLHYPVDLHWNAAGHRAVAAALAPRLKLLLAGGRGADRAPDAPPAPSETPVRTPPPTP